MRKIIIPEGKVLFTPSGNYTFKGPIEVPESILLRKSLPETFTDGTPWEFVEDTVEQETKEDSVSDEQPENESVQAKGTSQKSKNKKNASVSEQGDEGKLL